MSDHPCKKCHFKYGFLDYYYKTGEGTFFCNQCGYCETYYVEWNGNEPQRTSDGAVKFVEKISGGCGTYHYKPKGEIATSVGNFHVLTNLEEGRREFLEHYSKKKDEIEVAEITYFENGEWYHYNLVTEEKFPYYVYHQLHKEIENCKCGGRLLTQDIQWKSRFFCDKGCGQYIDINGNRDLYFVKEEELKTNGG